MPPFSVYPSRLRVSPPPLPNRVASIVCRRLRYCIGFAKQEKSFPETENELAMTGKLAKPFEAFIWRFQRQETETGKQPLLRKDLNREKGVCLIYFIVSRFLDYRFDNHLLSEHKLAIGCTIMLSCMRLLSIISKFFIFLKQATMKSTSWTFRRRGKLSLSPSAFLLASFLWYDTMNLDFIVNDKKNI